jgi:hypothetical protein
MGPPSNYKPRRNNYKPLRDLDKNSPREASEQQITQSNQPSREPGTSAERAPTRPERHHGDRTSPGGPESGAREPVETYAIKQLRAAAADRQARQSTEQAATPPRQRTPVKELVKQSAKEVTAPAIDRTNSPEIER